MTTDSDRSPAARVMDEAIDLVLEGCSPYPERAAFIDADTPQAGRQIQSAADEGLSVVLVGADSTTRILRPSGGWHAGYRRRGEHRSLGDADLERLGNVLDREGVVAATLIGFERDGAPGPLPEVEIAIWHDPKLDPCDRSDLQIGLAGDAARALGADGVDVFLLNSAPPLRQHRAMRDGKRLIVRDHDERVRLETRALLDYLDTEPLRAAFRRTARRRMEVGR